MATKKDRAIEAIEILMDNYKNEKYYEECPLCNIFPCCFGCPNYEPEGDVYCESHLTYNKRRLYDLRLKFWIKYLPYLKKLDKSHFTKRGDHSVFKKALEIDKQLT